MVGHRALAYQGDVIGVQRLGRHQCVERSGVRIVRREEIMELMLVQSPNPSSSALKNRKPSAERSVYGVKLNFIAIIAMGHLLCYNIARPKK